jgi:hypothetical protein
MKSIYLKDLLENGILKFLNEAHYLLQHTQKDFFDFLFKVIK